MLKSIYFFILFNLIFLNNAFAYLDPGTGSIILQAILGVIAAGLTFFTNFWIKVKIFFKNIFKKKNLKK
jgi:hypothetical protein|tara:strand:- start:1667 stop:1873 length:207 start_codon:yes stop_codon:yes gene_type:complete